MVQVWRQPLFARYNAPFCSLASIYMLLCWVGIVVVSFLIAYGPPGFWRKENTTIEQPKITYQHKLCYVADLDSGSALTSCVGIPEYNAIVPPSTLRLPTELKSNEDDSNMDGRPDTLSLQFSLRLNSGERVVQFRVAPFFLFSTNYVARSKMMSPVIISAQSANPAYELQVLGDLRFTQRNPIPSYGIRDVYNVQLFNGSEIKSMQDVTFKALGNAMFARNESLLLESHSVTWTLGETTKFSFEAVIRIPDMPIRYIPGVPEVLLWAWVAFLSIFILLFVPFYVFQDFIFRNQIVEARVRLDTVPVEKLHQY